MVKEVAARPRGLRLSLTRARQFFPTTGAALAAAQRAIAELRATDFVQTLIQNPDICDVYAVTIDRAGWYLKLTMLADSEGETVMLISFHPLEHPIRKASGHEVKP